MFRGVSRFVLAFTASVTVPACGGGSGGGEAAEPDPVVTPSVSTPVPVNPGAAPSTGAALASPASLASVTEGVAPLGVVFSAVGAHVNGSGEAVVQPDDADYG